MLNIVGNSQPIMHVSLLGTTTVVLSVLSTWTNTKTYSTEDHTRVEPRNPARIFKIVLFHK